MQAKSTGDRYGSVAIGIHWLSAAAIVVLFALGLVGANSGDPSLKAALLRTHVPLGVFVLLLTVLRILWWFVDRRPAPLPSLPRWQASMETGVRWALYAAILLIGASGIGLLALSGAGAVLFFHAPDPLPDFWRFPPMFAHFLAACGLFTLVVLHVAAALYHHILRGDRLLARMGVG
jgi:cytochrome b561